MKKDNYQLAHEVEGDSAEDTSMLRSMGDDARSYLSGFYWCPKIKNLYLAVGIGGVIGLFLAELEAKINDHDDYLWVVVGDLPSAYFVADSNTPQESLEMYCSLMADWADAVESNCPLDDVFPVAVKPTSENALLLKRRLSFLKEQVLPSLAGYFD